jgi:hypothetical protein
MRARVRSSWSLPWSVLPWLWRSTAGRTSIVALVCLVGRTAVHGCIVDPTAGRATCAAHDTPAMHARTPPVSTLELYHFLLAKRAEWFQHTKGPSTTGRSVQVEGEYSNSTIAKINNHPDLSDIIITALLHCSFFPRRYHPDFVPLVNRRHPQYHHIVYSAKLRFY